MIIGAHAIICSKDPDADRAFLRDVLGFPHVDAGKGWLIFRLPPAELAVHPGENDVHELYLMTDDVEALVASMKARGIEAAPISRQAWGLLTRVTLPGGGELGIYEPQHASPSAHGEGGVPKRKASVKRRSRTPKRGSKGSGR